MEPTEDLAAHVVATLLARGQTLATAESLTGGLIGAALTGVPGASAAYRGGVVAYATDLKHTLAGVPAEVLDAWGPVAAQTASALAAGAQAAAGADWGLSATGVAGPTAQDGHPPGEVWVGVAAPGRPARAEGHHFVGDRRAVRTASVEAALRLLAAALDETGNDGNNPRPRGVEQASIDPRTDR